MSKERIIVGLPYPEDEEPKCLGESLKFIDRGLNILGIDASVLVIVNGTNTSLGKPPQISVPRNKYNTDINITYCAKKGQASAMMQVIEEASRQGVSRIFLVDDDIFHFPHAMMYMWDETKPVVGSNYLVYPLKVVEQEIRPLTSEEKFYYLILEAEKNPVCKKIIDRYIPRRKGRIKGSLMLIDIDWAKRQIPDIYTIVDSAISSNATENDITTAQNAYFMYMGRVSLPDRVRSVYRHYDAARQREDFNKFAPKQINFNEEQVKRIVADIIQEVPVHGKFLASLLLFRYAEYQRVHGICKKFAEERIVDKISSTFSEDPYNTIVSSFSEALEVINYLLLQIDLSKIFCTDDLYSVTTKELPRVPIDMLPYLTGDLRGMILDHMGLDNTSIL